MKKTVIITGAGGFIGSALVTAFAQADWNVIALCRRTPSSSAARPNVEYRHYELGDALTCDGDVLVHCAYDAGAGASVNIEGATRLFASARDRNVSKIVFLSSLASKADAASRYGSEKFRIEQMLRPGRDLIVRPGLVIGNGGLFAAMLDSLRRLRLAPVFNGGMQPVYTVTIADLCAALLRLVERESAGAYTVAAPQAVTMKDFYRGLAQAIGVRVRLIPLPYTVTLWLLSAVEKTGARLPISSESVRGVRNLRALTVASSEDLGIRLKPFDVAVQELAPH